MTPTMKSKSTTTFLFAISSFFLLLHNTRHQHVVAAATTPITTTPATPNAAGGIHLIDHHVRTFTTIDRGLDDGIIDVNTTDAEDEDYDNDDNEHANDYNFFSGINGLVYDWEDENFYALPKTVVKHDHFTKKQKHQHQHQHDPPRIYATTIEHEQVQVDETMVLKDEDGVEFEAGDFHPYALAFDGDNLFVAHNKGYYTDAGVFAYDLNGVYEKEIELPSHFHSKLVGITAVGRGEGDDRDGSTLYCVFHNGHSNSTDYHIIAINSYTGGMEEEFIYKADESSTLVTLVALKERGILALERVVGGAEHGDQDHHRGGGGDDAPSATMNIYYAPPLEEEHRHLHHEKNDNHDATQIKKVLLTTLNHAANYQSMALRHAGAKSSLNRYELILISQNNFSQTRATEITIFRVWYHHHHENTFDDHIPQHRYPHADETCITFCEEYQNICSGQRYSLYDKEEEEPKQSTTMARHLLHDGKPNKQCLYECMQYPRPPNPLEYEIRDPLGVNLGGDTLWCRMRHLALAAKDEPSKALFCPQAGPDGGGICTDAAVDGETPYKQYKEGMSDSRHTGYCELLADGTIADCSSAGIDDHNINTAMSMIPDTVEMIFMNDNRGITRLRNGTFENLPCPECIVSLFLEEANIKKIDVGVFDALVFLEVLNLNQNLVEELPEGMFDFNPYLRQFSMYQGPNKPGMLTSIPPGIFTYNWELERIVLDGHQDLTYLPNGMFDGLYECEMLSFKRCGLINDGIPDGIFNDLVSLLYFDFSTNYLTSAKASWFSSGWGEYVTRVAVNDNLIAVVEDGIFDTLVSLEYVYFHDNNITFVPNDLFENNPDLIASTM